MKYLTTVLFALFATPVLAGTPKAPKNVCAHEDIKRCWTSTSTTSTVTSPSTTVSTSGIKWTPGHYVFFGPFSTPETTRLAQLDEVVSLSQFKGATVRYAWAQLEPTK